MPLPSPSVGVRLDSLTGLRFFAALVVFGIHAGAVFDLQIGGYNPVLQGTVGVSFFFLLSGFLLAWSHRPHESSRVFWRRRFARIYPAFAAVWILVTVAHIVQSEDLGWPDVLSLVMVQSWFSDPAVYFAASAVFWSLSAEAFFYVVFPLIIGPLSRLSERQRLVTMLGIVAVVAGIGALVVSTGNGPLGTWFAYIFPPVRLLEFILGILVCLQYRHRPSFALPLPLACLLALAAYFVAGLAPGALRPVAVTLVPFALLVVSAAHSDATNKASAFRHPALVKLGEWSYCFYLIHLTVIALYSRMLSQGLGLEAADLDPLATVAHVLGALCVSLAASLLLYSLVEAPLNDRLRPRRQSAPLVSATDPQLQS
jgi:peptidoglycan/LPS O-acetylase OafA/YrhL